MVMLGVAGFVRQYVGSMTPAVMTRRTRILASIFLPLGGVIHGAFGTSGPLVVIYAARALTDKTVFRVTLRSAIKRLSSGTFGSVQNLV